MAKIYHAHLYGTREYKYQVLSENSFNSTDFQEIDPQSPFYLLIPQNTDLLTEYNDYFKITDVMPVNGVGMTTARDKIVIDFEKEPILERATIFRDSTDTDEEVCQKLDISLKKGWNIKNARELIKKEDNLEQYIKPVLYRPFDTRLIFYHDSLVWRTVKKIMKNLLLGDNLGLIVSRQLVSDFRHIFVTSNIVNFNSIDIAGSFGAGYCFPLYLYPETDKPQELQQKKRVNFSKEFLNQLTEKLGYLPTPEKIFYYIYAIFHSPTYRTRYAEFLKIDFPRVPITKNPELFNKLAEIGEQLVGLHLMTSPMFDPPLAPPSKGGEIEEKAPPSKRGEIEEKAPLFNGGWGDLTFISKGNHQVTAGHPKYKNNTVIINKDGDSFEGICEEIWNFYIGGYQVCQKWLKDRKERILSDEDILHYQKIIIAIRETIKLMKKIDTVIPSFPIE